MSNLNNLIIKLGLSNLLIGSGSFPNISITGTSLKFNQTGLENLLDGEYIFTDLDKTGRPVYTKEIMSRTGKLESKLYWHDNLQAWILAFNSYGTPPLNLEDNNPYQYIAYNNTGDPTTINNWEACFAEKNISNIQIAKI